MNGKIARLQQLKTKIDVPCQRRHAQDTGPAGLPGDAFHQPARGKDSLKRVKIGAEPVEDGGLHLWNGPQPARQT